jgi:hypothetical protein
MSQDDVVMNVVPIDDHELLGRVGRLQLVGKCPLYLVDDMVRSAARDYSAVARLKHDTRVRTC